MPPPMGQLQINDTGVKVTLSGEVEAEILWEIPFAIQLSRWELTPEVAELNLTIRRRDRNTPDGNVQIRTWWPSDLVNPSLEEKQCFGPFISPLNGRQFLLFIADLVQIFAVPLPQLKHVDLSVESKALAKLKADVTPQVCVACGSFNVVTIAREHYRCLECRYEGGEGLKRSLEIARQARIEQLSTTQRRFAAKDNLISAKQLLLALLGDSITTDHISPAGGIARDTPAADFLTNHQVRPVDFNSFGARRGNHQVMKRGTFANIRLKNMAAKGTTGGFARHVPSGEVAPLYDVATRYADEGTPLVIIGGKEYGTGSSRDWAAKGTALLGIKAVIVESFERIHRSNLIGMGVLPLQFLAGVTRETLGLTGDEVISLTGLSRGIKPGMTVKATFAFADGHSETVNLLARIDTDGEADYFKNGGILQYVLRQLAA